MLMGVRGTAQDQPAAPMPPEHHHMAQPSGSTWSWATDANVIIGYDYQQRLFADFAAVESQNWFMASGSRNAGPGRLTLTGMASLEPLTIGRLVYAGDGGMTRQYSFSPTGERVSFGGSPQLFQTGESYQGVPFVNVQHPHDLIMGLGATYRIATPRLRRSSAPIWSDRRRSDRRRSCIASRRATTLRCRSPTTTWIRRTSPRGCCAQAWKPVR